jgi:hypothetical protein
MIAALLRTLTLASLLIAGSAAAHEIRPAYLQIDETTQGTYDVLWKVPSRGDQVLDIQPRFDKGLTLTKAGEDSLLDGFVVYRFRLAGPGGLPGTTLNIRNLENTTIDVLANVSLLDRGRHSFLLQPRSSSTVVPTLPSKLQVVKTYTALGVEHILLGIDHLLFVAALMLIVPGWRILVKTVTAFTVAHSITLALSTFSIVSLPAGPVEALIALSIVLVCVEAVRRQRGETSLAIEWPWLVAFAFGLLHGFGFAGALSEIGMPHGDIPLALLFFNIGVELGQLAFIGGILAVLAFMRSIVYLPRHAHVMAAYGMGTVASFWVFQRLGTVFF